MSFKQTNNNILRKPFAKLDANSLIREVRTPCFINSSVEKENTNTYENLLKKTQTLQNNLKEIKDGILLKENRERCKSFYSSENSTFSINTSDLPQEKTKLFELNMELINKNKYLTHKIRLMEEREKLLLKTIEQLRKTSKQNENNV